MLVCLFVTIGPLMVALLSSLVGFGLLPASGVAYGAALLVPVGTMFLAALIGTCWAVRGATRATSGVDNDNKVEAYMFASTGSGMLCCLYLAILVWALTICFAGDSVSSVVAGIPFLVILGLLCCVSCGFGVASLRMQGGDREERLSATLGFLVLTTLVVLLLLQTVFVALKLDGSITWPWRVALTPAWIVEAVALLIMCVAIPVIHLIPVLFRGQPMPEEGFALLQIASSVCCCLFLPITLCQILLCIWEEQEQQPPPPPPPVPPNQNSSSTAALTVPGYLVPSPVVLGWALVLVLVALCRAVSWCSRSERFMRQLNEMSEDDFCRELLAAAEREEEHRVARDRRLERDIRRYLLPHSAADGPPLLSSSSSPPPPSSSTTEEAAGGGAGVNNTNRTMMDDLASDPGVASAVSWVGRVAALVAARPLAQRTPELRAAIERAVLEKQEAGLWSGHAQAAFEEKVISSLFPLPNKKDGNAATAGAAGAAGAASSESRRFASDGSMAPSAIIENAVRVATWGTTDAETARQLLRRGSEADEESKGR